MLREAAELLDVPVDEVDLPLSDSIDRELDKMGDEKPKYRLRERASTIYATADERISHVRRAGDVDNGKAWRAVRRPSDMVSKAIVSPLTLLLTTLTYRTSTPSK